MDISSVRFQPVPVQAQAAIASTHGHPRMIGPVRPKFNNYIIFSMVFVTDQGIVLKNVCKCKVLNGKKTSKRANLI